MAFQFVELTRSTGKPLYNGMLACMIAHKLLHSYGCQLRKQVLLADSSSTARNNHPQNDQLHTPASQGMQYAEYT